MSGQLRRLWFTLGTIVVGVLPGCIYASERLLDHRRGVADPYFVGKFEFTNRDGTNKRIQIYLKDNQYLVEAEPGLLLVSLHSLKGDILVAQQWNPRLSRNFPPYTYYLIRKSAEGFELGEEALCKPPCTASTSAELLQRLEDQSRDFAADPKKRVAFRRT